jgi:hypothetical protein
VVRYEPHRLCFAIDAVHCVHRILPGLRNLGVRGFDVPYSAMLHKGFAIIDVILRS